MLKQTFINSKQYLNKLKKGKIFPRNVRKEHGLLNINEVLSNYIIVMLKVIIHEDILSNIQMWFGLFAFIVDVLYIHQN